MKVNTLLVVLWLCLAPAQAQQIIEKHLDFTGKESVNLNIKIADSINIQTWNKNEVSLKAFIFINNNRDNDGYESSFNTDGNSITVNAGIKNSYFKNGKRHNICNDTTSIYWQVFIPEKVRFSVETINGDITVTGKTGEMRVKSISGYIDLTVPVDKNADLDFSTVSGRMYSDHKLNASKTHSGVPLKLSERLNNGGDRIVLETISGDIFFRKSN